MTVRWRLARIEVLYRNPVVAATPKTTDTIDSNDVSVGAPGGGALYRLCPRD
jgi:hypothetical protein